MRTEYPERYITLGLKIAYYRKKAGYTQEVLAEKIGKSVNFLAQVEGTGTTRGVSLETLFKIAGTQLKSVLEYQAICDNLIFPHTIGVLLKQFFLLIRHGCPELFFVPEDQLH